MGTRRLAREIGLQLLYEIEMKQAEPRAVLSLFWKKDHEEAIPSTPDDAKEYATELVEGVCRHIKEIDEMIEKHSHHWKLARMAVVDRNILRLGTFELLHKNSLVPPNVVLDEAVEISKKFGTAESSAFVNGILDHIAQVSKTAKGVTL